jgi:micrococcal nuclease
VQFRRALPWLLVAVLVAALGVGSLTRRGAGSGGAGAASARILRVVDGDTVVARLSGGVVERVRYIGMDTPEDVRPGVPVQCYSLRAAAANRRLVTGREVRLVFDRERRDRYGRLLAYVYRRDRLFVNAALVARGYARPYPFPPNTAHAGTFARLARRARARELGLWSRC